MSAGTYGYSHPKLCHCMEQSSTPHWFRSDMAIEFDLSILEQKDIYVEPPISDREHHYEVSCHRYEHDGIGDTNDDWIILATDSQGNELYSEPGSEHEYPKITARATFVILVHVTGCRVGSFDKKLPPWSFEQGEVVCGLETL